MKRTLNILLISIALILFSGCTGNPFNQFNGFINIDDGVMRDDNGDSIYNNGTIPTGMHDAIGNPTIFYEANDGTFYPSVHQADVHEDWISHYFFRTIQTYEIAANATSNNYNLTLNSTTGLVVGNILHVGEGSQHEHEPAQIIAAIVNNTITLDRPLDKNHTIGELVTKIEIDLSSIAGSIPNYVSYRCQPQGNQTWHIKKLKMTCNDNADMDFTNFCGINTLTNGLVLREYDGLTNSYTSYFVIKSNGNMIDASDETQTLTKTGGGEYSFWGIIDLSVVDVAFNIDGNNGDYLEILVQDNLATISNINWLCFGHVEGR